MSDRIPIEFDINKVINRKKPFIISTIICKTVRGQNDPTLGVHVLKNTLGVRGLKMARIVSLIFLFCGTRPKKGSPSLP